MTSDDDKSFRERVEEIRQERKEDNGQKSFSENTDNPFREREGEIRQERKKDNRQKSFSGEVEKVRDEMKEGEKQGTSTSTEDIEMGQGKAIISIIAMLFTLGFVGATLANGQPGLALLALAGAFGAWMVLTEEGREAGREIMSEMEDANQQQNNHRSNRREERRICSECGWQNPARNTYCNDCGTKFQTNE